MKRQIKFRGRDSKGRLHYGVYHEHDNGKEYIFDRNRRWKIKSAAQLVGYDVNGEEIYDGDELVDAEGKQYTARIANIIQDDNGLFAFLPYPTKLMLKQD